MSLSPFDTMNLCFTKTKYFSDEDFQGYTQWIMNKILSNDQTLCYLACELSKNISDRMHYDVLYYGLATVNNKGKGKFIPWLCAKPKKEQEILYLMEYYNCNQTDAKMYREIISEEEMKKIVDFNVNRGVVKK